MSALNVADLLYAPGKLYANPSALTGNETAFGTALGLVSGLAIDLEGPHGDDQAIRMSEHGNEISDMVEGARGIRVSGVLQSWDADMIQRLFPNSSVDATVGAQRKVAEPSSVRPGARASDRSIVLLFMPDDSDRVPCLVLHRALPAIEAKSRIEARLDREWGIPFAFTGIRDTSSRLYTIGMRHGISV